jgi:predicted GIY-YIG superfamily endonuclease
MMPTPKTKRSSKSSASENPPDIRRGRHHHSVYVVLLRNPKGDGKAAYYVGMTGLTPEHRFRNHKSGLKAARVVRKYGERLVPRLYQHLNPMPYQKAKTMEGLLADSLRKRGYVVFGGH